MRMSIKLEEMIADLQMEGKIRLEQNRLRCGKGNNEDESRMYEGGVHMASRFLWVFLKGSGKVLQTIWSVVAEQNNLRGYRLIGHRPFTAELFWNCCVHCV